ncbi:MAG: phage Gp37/Gp68 family protein [Prevotella sp.]|nr:phage Gp37/Gp68 family protein [Prevotella sp.]
MSTTKIEWTDATWNPVTGCTKTSAGCAHCYAEMMSRRLKAMGTEKYKNGFQVTLHEDALNEPKKWRKPRTIFVCSMSDLFHKDVPFEFVDKVMQVIKETPQHRYQLLTKRAERMEEYFQTREVPKNAWLGVTVEVVSSKPKMESLRAIQNAPIRFLSCEPLLEDLGELDLTGIDWIIVGGESGTQARPMKEEWVKNIKAQCDAAGKAFFFKQWGTWGSDGVKRDKHKNGKQLDGKICQAMPDEIRTKKITKKS